MILVPMQNAGQKSFWKFSGFSLAAMVLKPILSAASLIPNNDTPLS
jgi:hypothetical protein